MFKKKITTKLTVNGMHCNNCANKVKDTLLTINGVKNVKIDLEKKQVEITSTEELNQTLVKEKITALGYEVLYEENI